MFKADRKHIHHRLLALGFSHRDAVLVLYTLASGLSFLALLAVMAHYRNAGFIAIAITLATYIGIRKLGYEEVALLRTGTLLHWYESVLFNRRFFLGFIDIVLIVAAYGGAYVLKYDEPWSTTLQDWYTGLLPVVLVVQLGVLYVLGLYRCVWRAAEINDLIRVASKVLLAVAVSYVFALVSLPPMDMLEFFLLDALLLSSLLAGIRGTYRVLDYMQQRENSTGEAALIYGAGRGGQLVLRELLQNPRFGLRPIGFLDDDLGLQGRLVNGVPVLGSIAHLEAILASQSIACLVLSSSKISGDCLDEAISVCQTWRIPVLQGRLTLERVTPELSGTNCTPLVAVKA
jgi:UDP-GlcNAc:undecaprenyl-phosphate GlcNAc-1-phosphate transferase